MLCELNLELIKIDRFLHETYLIYWILNFLARMDETAERSTVAWYNKQHGRFEAAKYSGRSLDEKKTHTRLLYRYKDINNDQKLQYI